MGKRVASIDPGQLGFTFDPPAPARLDADLAGLGRKFAAIVSLALKDDPRSREEVAGAMSALLGEDVSKMMLDAYASEARKEHAIPAHRLWALIAVTDRLDLLDAAARRIGAALLVGEELHAARLGSLQAQRDRLDAEIKKMRGQAQPITRGRA
ncbi:MAG: DNA transposition protein [Pseudomonadota bacterium]